jgi:hypothetical protein
MDNQEEVALPQVEGEETPETTTPVVEEKTAEETPETTTEGAPEEEVAEVETEPKAPKKGANARIGELVGEVKSLKQRLAEVTAPGVSTPPMSNQAINLDAEVTPEQYRQHVLQTAGQMVDLKMKQSEAISRIDKESSEVMRAYPQLDPDSDSFDKELSETVSEAIEAQVRLNPYSASVKKFADKLMKPFNKAVSNGVAQEKETITKQVSQSALRPTAIRTPEKKTEEMSIAELEAKLGIVAV